MAVYLYTCSLALWGRTALDPAMGSSKVVTLSRPRRWFSNPRPETERRERDQVCTLLAMRDLLCALKAQCLV